MIESSPLEREEDIIIISIHSMAFQSVLRCLENVPLVGHAMAAGYACSDGRTKAERAGLKATLGLVLAPVSLVAEIADEATRKRSKQLDGAALTPRPRWMKKHHRKPLTSICLPGAHHAGTFKVSKRLTSAPLAEGWSRCQKVDIYRQLLAGVRFLDVSVMTRGNDVWTCADHVRGVKLEEVLTRVRDFVSDNPSEVVVVHIATDQDSVDWTSCHVLIQQLFRNRLIPEHMRDMTIGDIVDQGKNIVISGMADYAYSWQQIQYRWPNKASPEELGNDLRTTLTEMALYRPTWLFWYRAECTPSSPMYVRSFGGLPGLVASKYGAEKFDSVEDLALATNYSVLDVLMGLTRIPFNVLSIDFVHDFIVERIVKLNDASEKSLRISSIDVSANDEADDVFTQQQTTTTAAAAAAAAAAGVHRGQQQQMNNTTMNSHAAMNSSFDFRGGRPVPPVQVKETTM